MFRRRCKIHDERQHPFDVVRTNCTGLPYRRHFQVGLLGVWIAQTLDWVVRAGFYIVRYLGHKWENKSVVRAAKTAA